MIKRYDVFYVLNEETQKKERIKSYNKHVVLSTDNLDEAIECYANFIYDNYFSNKINYCSLVDNNFTKRIMYTEFLF